MIQEKSKRPKYRAPGAAALWLLAGATAPTPADEPPQPPPTGSQTREGFVDEVQEKRLDHVREAAEEMKRKNGEAPPQTPPAESR